VSLTDENGTRVFSYDANGNCVNDGKRLYEWDVQNRLIRVIVPNEGEVRFRYRADGMRVEKQVVGGLTTKYVYDGQTVIGEIRSDGTKRWYVLGAMGYVCRIDEGANGEILARDYFVYDGLGSCRALVSSSGIVVAKYDYDVYGSIRGQEGQRANSFKYVAQIGHPTDEETGLIYMRARYYDPEIGRFVSEDPGQNGINWFIYTTNNPVNMIDYDGKEPTKITWEYLLKNTIWWLGVLYAVFAYYEAKIKHYSEAVGYASIAIAIFTLDLIGLVSSGIIASIIIPAFSSSYGILTGMIPFSNIATVNVIAEIVVISAFIYGLVVAAAVVAASVYENENYLYSNGGDI
jgi:RHS repeat-associated protein